MNETQARTVTAVDAAEQLRLQVAMGEVKIGAQCELLQAILGSCVGIGFIWKRGGLCGLAHCLLPEAPAQVHGIGARYVSQAITSLLSLMGVRESDYADVQVVVAGGASMFRGTSPALQVGQRNTEAAQRYLRQRGLQVAFCDIGGRTGRHMSIDCAQQSFAITRIAVQEHTDNRNHHQGRRYASH